MKIFVAAVLAWNIAIVITRVCALYAEQLPSQRRRPQIPTERFVAATFIRIAFCGWAAYLVAYV